MFVFIVPLFILHSPHLTLHFSLLNPQSSILTCEFDNSDIHMFI
jgi:hypothetical protein